MAEVHPVGCDPLTLPGLPPGFDGAAIGVKVGVGGLDVSVKGQGNTRRPSAPSHVEVGTPAEIAPCAGNRFWMSAFMKYAGALVPLRNHHPV